jgi:hypothetical protein
MHLPPNQKDLYVGWGGEELRIYDPDWADYSVFNYTELRERVQEQIRSAKSFGELRRLMTLDLYIQFRANREQGRLV